MLVSFRNFTPTQIQNNNNQNRIQHNNNRLTHDSVSFTGMSKPSQYNNIFEFLAAKVLSGKKKFVNEDELSANKVKKYVDTIFEPEKIYEPCVKTVPNKIKWQAYVPEDIKFNSALKVNEAREERLDRWKKVLETPDDVKELDSKNTLKNHIKKNKSIRIVVWNAINSELKDNNRHIPVPFNAEALEQTIKGFEAIQPLDRKVRCKEISFLEMYTHRLRDNLLTEKGLADNQKSIWVKIPSIKHDPGNKDKNISDVEVLSYKNWCTRSNVDKAEDVLKDGDFYIYLERGKNDMWQPLIGMATYDNKICQIQGTENNNIIPIKHLGKVKEFIESNKLKCQSGIVDEGPRAYQQILISEKLSEHREGLEHSFEKALKENDTLAIFEYLDKPAKVLEDGTYEIKTYKPVYIADKQKGIAIPYNMLGVNEDKLLDNVSKINGDFIMDNKDKTMKSSISHFPEKLTQVTGKISCTKEQYEKFGEDIERVALNKGKIAIHN